MFTYMPSFFFLTDTHTHARVHYIEQILSFRPADKHNEEKEPYNHAYMYI